MWLWPTLMLVLLAQEQPQARALAGPSEATVLELDLRKGLVDVVLPDDSVTAPGSRLLLATRGEPRTWAVLCETDGRQATFEVQEPGQVLAGGPWRAWILGPSLIASLLPRWPTHAALHAEVDTVGPGGQSAWIRAGANDAIAVGDAWWLRVGRQPAARCDVLFVAADVSYCAVVPLASVPALRPGARVALWPTPAERREGCSSSAVAYLEERGHDTLAWVAAPPNVQCPPEPHLDFYRDTGRYLGHAVVERRDSRFWYARFLPTAGASEGPVPATQRGASSAPTESRPAPVAASTLRVGDDAVIRTQADIDARRFVAHIFELTPAGALLNAGEADGLAIGDTLRVYRDGTVAAELAVREVQRSYAVVEPLRGGDARQFVLRVGEELRFHPPPPPLRVVASVDNVIGETLFTARVTTSPVPLGTPLAIRASGHTVGVAILVTADEQRAGGFMLPCSQTRPLATGMQLVCEGDPAPRKED